MDERELGRALALVALRPVAARLTQEAIAERELEEGERVAATAQRIQLHQKEVDDLSPPRLVNAGDLVRGFFDSFGDLVFGFVVTSIAAFVAGAIVQAVVPGDNTTLPVIAAVLVLVAPLAILAAAAYADYDEALEGYKAKRDELQRLIADDRATLQSIEGARETGGEGIDGRA